MATTGACLCGMVTYEYDGSPVLQALCHCRNCQRQSGSSYSMIQVVPRSSFRSSGPIVGRGDVAESGNILTRHFCTTCGSPIYISSANLSDMTIVNAGTLDEPANFTPQMNIWTRSAQPWIALPDLPSFPCNPPSGDESAER